MRGQFKEYSCLDKWTAVLMALLILILCVMGLDRGHVWGDDFAAYMLEGIAIAENRLDEQIILNNKLHPSLRDFGGHENEETLVYVWGLPWILSAVYRMVGYDKPLGEQIIWYKIPGVVCLGILGAVLFLFYRRRLPYGLSLFLTSLIVLNRTLVLETNHIMTDIPCLTASVSAFLFLDLFLEETGERRRVLYTLLLGILLWFVYVVRLNGVTIVGIVLLGHVLELCFRKIPMKKWPRHAWPYLVFLLLLSISYMYFPQATSNADHIASGPNHWIIRNMHHYNQLIKEWLYSMTKMGFSMKWYPLHILLYGLAVCGMMVCGLRSLHLSILLIGTGGVLLLLPYYQDLRYLYNALPVLMLYAGYGIMQIGTGMKKICKPEWAKKTVALLGAVCMCYIGVCNVGSAIGTQVDHLKTKGMDWRYGAYSEDACDMYDYISGHVDLQDQIGFFKPRVLHLNTGRVSFVPGLEGRKFEDADYFLITNETEYIWDEIPEKIREKMIIVHENGTMELYKVDRL